MNRITTGIIAKSDAANRYCHSIMLYPLNTLIPTVKGSRSLVEIRHSATVYSFHALIKMKINVVTIPGCFQTQVRKEIQEEIGVSLKADEMSEIG